MSISGRQGKRRRGLSPKRLQSMTNTGNLHLFTSHASQRHVWSKPEYKHTYNVFRALPQPDEDEPSGWSPMKFYDEEGDEFVLGSWVHPMSIAAFVGRNKYSFVVDSLYDPIYLDANSAPYRMVCSTAYNEHKNRTAPPEWKDFEPNIKGREKNDDSMLMWPDTKFYIQAVTYEKGSVQQRPPLGLNAADPNPTLPIVELSYSANGKMSQLLLDSDNMGNVVPDIISWLPEEGAGGFIQIAQVQTGPHPQLPTIASTYDKFGKAVHGYDVMIIEEYFDGVSPIYDAGVEDRLKSMVTPWEQVFHVPGPEEQIKLICRADLPPSLIVKALDERYGEFIPEDIRRAGQKDLGWGRPQSVPESAPWGGNAPEEPVRGPAARPEDAQFRLSSKELLEKRRAQAQSQAQPTAAPTVPTAPVVPTNSLPSPAQDLVGGDTLGATEFVEAEADVPFEVDAPADAPLDDSVEEKLKNVRQKMQAARSGRASQE